LAAFAAVARKRLLGSFPNSFSKMAPKQNFCGAKSSVLAYKYAKILKTINNNNAFFFLEEHSSWIKKLHHEF